jgi:hypothetical protein
MRVSNDSGNRMRPREAAPRPGAAIRGPAPVASSSRDGRSHRHSGSPHRLDPNHHLWRNGRLWWVAFTVHLPNWTVERVRLSLGTADVREARLRRDEVLDRYTTDPGCELSLRNARRAG